MATKDTPRSPTSRAADAGSSTTPRSKRALPGSLVAESVKANKATRAVTAVAQLDSTRLSSPDDEIPTPVRARKAGEIVAERFRTQIANGTLAIGHQLPREEELTAMFGIARTTLREALRVLESQGLLQIKRGRGGGGIITMPKLDTLAQSFAIVLQLRQTSLADIDDARLMIEPPLAGRLAAKHTDEDLDALRAIVDRAHDAAEANVRDQFGIAAAELHETIIERGGNTTMAVIGTLLHDLLDRHLRKAAFESDQDNMRRAVRSYRKLLVLIESGDAAATSAHWHRQLVFLQQRRGALQLLDVYDD
jgi:GntR family transcriptional regulator, transcriptional repressor for pyruvate dehydrogenase complex